jgi:hypothetical protein
LRKPRGATLKNLVLDIDLAIFIIYGLIADRIHKTKYPEGMLDPVLDRENQEQGL